MNQKADEMVADRSALFQELYKVLQPGGTVAVTTGLGTKAYTGETLDAASLEQLRRPDMKKKATFCVFNTGTQKGPD